jgi:hypothetical protein
METQKISSQRLAIITGLYICGAMILYFMLMAFFGLAAISELRFLNFVIAGAGAAIAIKYYNRRTESHIRYLEGLNLCFTAILASALFFAVFIFFYFSVVDPALLNVIKTDAPMMGKYLTPFSASISVIAEGIVSGLILSFALMQYFKDDALHHPYKQRGNKLQEPEKES